jgi:hypothetical protein
MTSHPDHHPEHRHASVPDEVLRDVEPAQARRRGLAAIATLLVPVVLVPVVLGFTSDPDSGRTLEVSGTLRDEASATVADPGALSATPTASVPAPAVSDSPALAAPPPPCGSEYEVVSGDYWIRIAGGTGPALDDLLAVNSASVDTPLFPGGTICLPAGASAPPPPPATTAAPATAAPATAAPATAAPATAAPATAAPVTRTPAPRNAPTPTARSGAPSPTAPPAPAPRPTAAPSLPAGSNATPEQVQAIIRDVWPDALEDKAIEVARRESTFRPTAKNFCCYGIFQIYWDVHKGWLSGMGITSPEQLYDPTVNARAALALYQRSGGWGPWGG